MGRTTQYIGLTDDAIEYVKRSMEQKTFLLCHGMFGEPVMGTRYIMEVPCPDVNVRYVLEETVQMQPWSSGMMIFTSLKPILTKKVGQVIEGDSTFFDWVLDPTLKEKNAEFDYSSGKCYV